MRAFVVLARMRVLDTLRSRSSAAFFFGFPVVLLGLLGLVFANGHPFEDRVVAIVSADEALSAALREQDGLRVTEAPSRAHAEGQLRARMVSAILVREGGRDRLLVGPRDTLLGLGMMSVLGEGVALEVLEVPRFGYVHYLFPGLLAFSVLIAGLFGMGWAMVRYRETRFLKKLATTPLSRTTFVAANLAARGALVLLQMLVLVAAAVLMFELPLTPAGLGWLVVITLLGLLCFLGLGFALACLITTEELIVDVISAINFPIILVSELFFPVDVLVWPIPALAAALPSTQMVRLLREVVLYGETDPAALAPGLLVMLAWTVGSYALALRVFRWQ